VSGKTGGYGRDSKLDIRLEEILWKKVMVASQRKKVILFYFNFLYLLKSKEKCF
jgi:hypothetical protein